MFLVDYGDDSFAKHVLETQAGLIPTGAGFRTKASLG